VKSCNREDVKRKANCLCRIGDAKFYCLSPQKHPAQGREWAGRAGEEEEEEEEEAREKKVACAGLDRGNLSEKELFFLKSKKVHMEMSKFQIKMKVNVRG
jgi:hypothetical protein